MRDESFMTGYVQVERQLPHRLTAFARVEDSSRMQESRYVALFNDHSSDIDVTLRRQALGLRWDYARRQALTCEFSHEVSLSQHALRSAPAVVSSDSVKYLAATIVLVLLLGARDPGIRRRGSSC